MTPFGETLLFVTLNAAGMVPSANIRFPLPNVSGYIFNQNASTKSCLSSVCMRFPLPQTCKSGPGSCLILRTFSAMSPPKNTDGCHSLEVMVFEATYLVAALAPGQSSACCCQYAAQMSTVF